MFNKMCTLQTIRCVLYILLLRYSNVLFLTLYRVVKAVMGGQGLYLRALGGSN